MSEIFVPPGLNESPSMDNEFTFLGEVVRGLTFPEDHHILEIGSLLGKSTITMALVAKHHIYAIDPHDGPWELFGDMAAQGGGEPPRDRREEMGNTYDQFISNLEQYNVRDKVTPIVAFSDQVKWSAGPICLLFLDGDHSYIWVKHDYEKFSPHVVPSGIIAFHDYAPDGWTLDKSHENHHIGVAKAVHEILAREPAEIEVIGAVGSLLITQKL